VYSVEDTKHNLVLSEFTLQQPSYYPLTHLCLHWIYICKPPY